MAKHTTATRRPAAQPTTTATPSVRPEAALKQTIADAASRLLEELRAGKSARFEELLQFSAKFHRYSFGNQILILSQCPEATRVAGYRAWEKLGYHVAKGQKAIRILAPRQFRREEEDEDGQPVVRQGLYFTSAAVFDASQLNPEEVAARPLPTFFVDLGASDQTDALQARVTAAMVASGIRVEARTDLDTGVQGYSSGGYVALRAALPSGNAVRTLVHEWAHELLHQGANKEAAKDLSRGVKECHAEATSYVVCAHFGLHNSLSSDYLQSWGTTPEGLLAELGQVQRAAAAIISALEGSAASQDTQDAEATVA